MSLPAWQIDTRYSTWQGRTLRYLTIYLLLALALVGARQMTQDIRPDLLAAKEQERQLSAQRDDLEIQLQSLTTPQRIQQWALSQGMKRFAESRPTIRDFGAAASVPPTEPIFPRLEVKTKWK